MFRRELLETETLHAADASFIVVLRLGSESRPQLASWFDYRMQFGGVLGPLSSNPSVVITCLFAFLAQDRFAAPLRS